MLEHATAQKALLVSHGMSETLLTMSPRRSRRSSRRSKQRGRPARPCRASADLEAVVTVIGEQVQLLDGLVRYRFGDNAELMGAWRSARNGGAGQVEARAEEERVRCWGGEGGGDYLRSLH
jgi:hypothetical protein